MYTAYCCHLSCRTEDADNVQARNLTRTHCTIFLVVTLSHQAKEFPAFYGTQKSSFPVLYQSIQWLDSKLRMCHQWWCIRATAKPTWQHTSNYKVKAVRGVYFIWQLSFITSRRHCAAGVGHNNTINKPTESGNRQLSDKMLTVYKTSRWMAKTWHRYHCPSVFRLMSVWYGTVQRGHDVFTHRYSKEHYFSWKLSLLTSRRLAQLTELRRAIDNTYVRRDACLRVEAKTFPALSLNMVSENTLTTIYSCWTK